MKVERDKERKSMKFNMRLLLTRPVTESKVKDRFVRETSMYRFRFTFANLQYGMSILWNVATASEASKSIFYDRAGTRRKTIPSHSLTVTIIIAPFFYF